MYVQRTIFAMATKLKFTIQAVTDAPCVCFSDELLAAYPDAKVILTLRDKQKWLASMETAYYRILESRDWKWFRALSALDLVSCIPGTMLIGH